MFLILTSCIWERVSQRSKGGCKEGNSRKVRLYLLTADPSHAPYTPLTRPLTVTAQPTELYIVYRRSYSGRVTTYL